MKFFTNGLIIKKQKYKEKDRIVTILTGGNGVIRAFARSAEDIKNPKCASTDILCYSRLTLSEGKDAYHINEAKILEQFPNLRMSPDNVALAQYFCELCLTLCPKESNAENYLKLILNSLYLLSNNKKKPLLIKTCFELKMMSLCGYMPDLIMCKECGAYETQIMYFVPKNGTIVCEQCAHEFEIKGIPLSVSAITAMRHILFSETQKLFSFDLSEDSLEALNKATESYVEYMTDKKYKTLDFYKALCQ